MSGTVVIQPPVEIDPATATELDQQLAAADGQGSTTVDFSSVTFCDSSGIRVLILHATRHHQAGGEFRIAGVPSTVRRVFDLAGVSELLGVEVNE
jgi:anti-sigma B factor antagonist